MLFLRQLLFVVDAFVILEVAIAPGGSCHVGLAAPVVVVFAFGKRKKGKREKEKKGKEKTSFNQNVKYPIF